MKISAAAQLMMKSAASSLSRKLHKLTSPTCRTEFKKTNKIGTKKHAVSSHAH